MKRTILTAAVALLGAAALVSSCDSRNIHGVVKELAEAPVDTTGMLLHTMRTNEFSVVEVDCFADVTYHQIAAGASPCVRVKAQREVLENLKIEVTDGELKLFVNRRYRMPEKAVVVADIYAPFASKFILDGGKCLRLGRLVQSGPLALELSGVGALVADSVEAPEISAELKGTGSIDLRGIRTGRLKASLDGTGMILLQGECGESVLEAVGTGRIDTTRLRTLRLARPRFSR